MTLRRSLVLVLALAGLAAPAGAGAASSLPSVTRTVTAPATTELACLTAPLTGKGLASARYTAPMSGYLTVRLAGTGDWDLLLRDAAGRAGPASQAFGGTETVQTWIAAGERVVAEGCRRTGAARSARIAFRLTDVKPPKDEGTASVVRVFTGLQGQAALDRAGLDVTESRSAKWADVIVYGDKQLGVARRLGAKVQTRVADLAAYDQKVLTADRLKSRSARVSALPSGRETYRTYEEIQAELKQLVDAHPTTVRPVVFGTSYQGREISGVEIANNVKADDDGRPVFFLMGVHHAREWPSAEIAMEFAHLMAEGTSDPRVKALSERGRVVILPLVNPDGYISSRTSPSVVDTIGDPTGDGTLQTGESVAPPGGVLAYRRKNCNNEDGNPATPCVLAFGVDNNRNYGSLWGGSGSSADPTTQTYHGSSPRSEPETQAVFDYVLKHHVTTLVSLHTIAGLVLRPPGLKELGRAPDEAAMKALGDAMGAATGYVSQYGFQLYDTAGTTEDDTYTSTGGYGYTVELGPSGGLFHGPYATNVVAQWVGEGAQGGMREALLKAAEVAVQDSSHARLAGTAKPGAVLRLRKTFATKTSRFCRRGFEPPVVNTPVPPDATCTEPLQEPLSLEDKANYHTTVGPDGTFTWHIGQSTRPFVNGGAEIDKEEDAGAPIATFTGTPGPPGTAIDHEFTAPADLGDRDKLRVHLGIPTGEDYDLEVFLKQPDGKLVPVGTSGNAPPSDEEFVIEDVQPGATYVARVDYFLALTGQYQLTVTRIAVSTTVTTGSKEAYTLTCETQSGNVLETLSLVIDRDQLVSVRLGCGDFPSTDAAGNPLNTSTNCVLLATAPAIGCAPVPTGKPTVDLSGGPFKVKLIKARRRQDQGRIARRGFYAVRCKLTAKGRCIVRARMGQRKIGTGRVRMKKANNRVVRIRLSRRALQRVQRGGKLKLRAVGRSPGHKRPRARLKVRIPPA